MAADLHALEIEFAKSPSLEACLPLCAAYVAAKRYMEAMVVCKKGIKNAAASDPRGRIMLAQVILAQGKAPKAELELNGILADFPNHPAALELLGRAHHEQGHRPEAIKALQAAMAQDSSLQQAPLVLAQLGVAPSAPVAVPPPVPAAGPASPGAPPMAAPPLPVAAPRPAPIPVVAAAPTPAAAVADVPPAVAPPGAPPAAAPLGATATAASLGAPPAASPLSPPVASGAAGSTTAGAGPASPAPATGDNAAPLTHVGDFFAPTTLGYSNEASGIETAGPGRLTILGFVPKNTGSLRTTLAVFVVIAVVAGAFMAYQYNHSRQQKRIGDLFAKIRTALDEDQYGRYREALSLGDKIFEVDPSHTLTESAMAYTHAVLAFEHHEVGAQDKAERILAQLASKKGEENEFYVAARALVATLKHDLDGGLKDVRAILQKGGSSPIVELEAFRLMNASQPEEKETKIQLRRVTGSVVNQARVLANLGWYYFDLEDNAKAAKYFEQTLQSVKEHPMAKMGRGLVALAQNVGLAERQKDIERDTKDVLATPAEALSTPVQAMAFFTRSQLRLWQKEAAQAEADYQAAVKADPTNTLFSFRRGLAFLSAGDGPQAVAALQPITGAECKNVRLLNVMVQAQTRAKMFTEARATLQRAQALAPKDTGLTLLAGALLSAESNWPAAISTYQSVTPEAGGDLYTQAQLGIGSAMLLSAPSQAVVHLEGVLAKLPEGVSADMQARLLCQLGQAYEATQNKAKALQSYAFGIDKNRFVADCHFFQCRILGPDPQGKEACKTYLTLEPHGRYASEAAALAN
jgi:tetratricopeptide (TPR) repeat protein